MKNKIPVLYLCIHQRLKNFNDPYTKKVIEFIRMICRIQKRYAILVLKEMENLDLVKIISWNKLGKIEVLDTNIDLENTSQLYKATGLI